MSKFLVRNNLIGIGLTDLQKNGENQYSHPHTVRRPCLFTYMPSMYLKSEIVFFADERAFVCQTAGKSVVLTTDLKKFRTINITNLLSNCVQVVPY